MNIMKNMNLNFNFRLQPDSIEWYAFNIFWFTFDWQPLKKFLIWLNNQTDYDRNLFAAISGNV